MAQSATEDMLSIAVIVGGFPITGFAGGGAIRFVKGVPDYAMRTGVGGLGSFNRVIDNSGTLSIDLLPTSDANDALNLALLHSKTRPNGANYAASVEDLSGRYSLVTASAAIMKNPDPTIGDGSGIMTWDLIAVQWFQNTGGRGATPVFEIADLPDLASLPGIRAAA